MDHNKAIVLFSGGWESTYCLTKAIKKFGVQHVIPVYADYWQVDILNEKASAILICQQLKIDRALSDLDLRGPWADRRRGLVVPGRNTILITSTVQQAAYSDCNINDYYIGVRAPFQWVDKYKDSNRTWARVLSKALGIKIHTPCLMLPKFYIKWWVRRHGITDEMIYSTEDNND